MAIAASMPGAGPSLFPLRKRTGTAAFHLSREAVDFGQEDLEKLAEKDAVRLLAEVTWGSATEMPCPHCGTIDTHYWRSRELRWKCKCCGKTFSVTSGTVFHDRKLPLTKILKISYSWANGASGKPALQLRRDWNIAYPTVFTLLHKLREGLSRGFNTGVLCGVNEMDGMDVLGRRYKEKRNKPQGGGAAARPTLPDHLLRPTVDPETGEIVGPPKPPKHGKAARQPADRRLMLVMRRRGRSKGKGASDTRVAIAITESTATVTAMAQRYSSTESSIVSDEDPAYAGFARLFSEHRTITHSREFSDGRGRNNNQAESFNHRMRRLVEGIYLNPSGKYLLSYAAEAAWREDTRRLSSGKKLRNLLGYVMGVGISAWWRGYSHGKHRTTELLVDGERPAKARGRPKGWTPTLPK